MYACDTCSRVRTFLRTFIRYYHPYKDSIAWRVCGWCMTVGVLDLYKRHARTLRLPSLDANMFQLTEPISAYHATAFA